MEKKHFILMVSIAFAIPVAGYFEENSKVEAAQDNTALMAPAEATPSVGLPINLTGFYCHKDAATNDVLGVLQGNNNDLVFSLSKWDIESGHSCGMNTLTAEKSANTLTWAFKEESKKGCIINIEKNDNTIKISNTAGDCSTYCGIRAAIGKTVFSLKSKLESDVTLEGLKKLAASPPTCPKT